MSSEDESTIENEWIELLRSLWDAVGKPVEERRLVMYARQLQSVPYGLLEQGISKVVMENTYNNVPTVGAIWGAIRRILNSPNMNMEDAIAQWEDKAFESAIVRF